MKKLTLIRLLTMVFICTIAVSCSADKDAPDKGFCGCSYPDFRVPFNMYTIDSAKVFRSIENESNLEKIIDLSANENSRIMMLAIKPTGEKIAFIEKRALPDSHHDVLHIASESGAYDTVILDNSDFIISYLKYVNDGRILFVAEDQSNGTIKSYTIHENGQNLQATSLSTNFLEISTDLKFRATLENGNGALNIINNETDVILSTVNLSTPVVTFLHNSSYAIVAGAKADETFDLVVINLNSGRITNVISSGNLLPQTNLISLSPSLDNKSFMLTMYNAEYQVTMSEIMDIFNLNGAFGFKHTKPVYRAYLD